MHTHSRKYLAMEPAEVGREDSEFGLVFEQANMHSLVFILTHSLVGGGDGR